MTGTCCPSVRRCGSSRATFRFPPLQNPAGHCDCTAKCPLMTQSRHPAVPSARQGDVSWALQRSRGSDCTSHGCLPRRSADILRPSYTGNPNGRLLWSPRTREPQRPLPAGSPTLRSQGGNNGENNTGHRYAPWFIVLVIAPSELSTITLDIFRRPDVRFRG
jgi:hypothetical protein